MGIIVDGVDCHDVHVVTPVTAAPIFAPTTVPTIVATKTVRVDHYNVYREPAPQCIADVTETQDLTYVHANRKANLNSFHQTSAFASAYNRLAKSCTSSDRILTALDG